MRGQELDPLMGVRDTVILMMIAPTTTTMLRPSVAASVMRIDVRVHLNNHSLLPSLTQTGRTRRRDSFSDSSVSHSPPRRRKSMGEQALEALGLGGIAAAAATGKTEDRSRNRSRRRRDSSSSSSSSSRYRSRRGGDKPKGKKGLPQALQAAVLAGGTEAWRSRKQPGGWAGEKGRRVLTAAFTAGGAGELVDKGSGKHGILGPAIFGVATNRLVNGSRSRSRSKGRGRRGRDRARSESRSGLKELTAAGLLTAAGKSIYDKVRSKSRGRRSVSSSSGSYDSRSPPRKRDKKKRSSSISAYASKGLAALGLGEAEDKAAGRHKHRSATFDDDYYHRSSRYGAPPPYGGGGYSDPRDVGQPRSGEYEAIVHRDAYGVDLSPHHLGDPDTDSDSDLGDSSEDERQRKKARATQMITAGLASVATIHAAHSVVKSMGERKKRYKAVAQGDMKPKQARREKNKARLQDAVSIGVAALGIKGAASEWKEIKEKARTAAELKATQERHRQKREARRLKLLSMGMQDRLAGSAPALSSQGYGFMPGGPTYFDGNPYDTSHYSPAPYPPYIPPAPPQPTRF